MIKTLLVVLALAFPATSYAGSSDIIEGIVVLGAIKSLLHDHDDESSLIDIVTDNVYGGPILATNHSHHRNRDMRRIYDYIPRTRYDDDIRDLRAIRFHSWRRSRTCEHPPCGQ